jgi:hypothetical protein
MENERKPRLLDSVYSYNQGEYKMNSTFVQALANTTTESLTANGMLTFDSSLDPCVDLFFAIGSSRGKDVTAQFERAFQSGPTAALRILFWARDVRGGAGERSTFRKLMLHLATIHPSAAKAVLHFVPEYGRWDDLLSLVGTSLEDEALQVFIEGLSLENGLCAKWAPRKGPVAKVIRNKLFLTDRAYRKLIVRLTNVVETKMCARQWDEVNYDHVPSLASARYQKAFIKHDAVRYQAYKEGLANGTNKINAAAVYPYDVIKSVNNGDPQVAIHQWNALPNFLGDDKIIPMVDTSGSMSSSIAGTKLTCMDVSVSLGLYIADKQTGVFKDMFLTFNANSRLEVLRGDLLSKLTQLRRADWGGNTDLASAYNEILRVAVAGNVSPNEMPKYLLILSDMEFDSATSSYNGQSIRAQDMAAEKFVTAGYELPKIVYWNLNARPGNVPVKFNEKGTAIISGFSPAIMKSVLAASQFSPMGIMLETINSPRYQMIAA